MLLPRRCGACDAIGPSPCARCAAALVRCAWVPRPAGLDACRALVLYEGPARELVARLKYRNHRGALAWMGRSLAALAAREPADVVTWAPTTPERRRERGFDHAEVLARRVARHLGLPARRLLRRLPGPPQTGRSGADRSGGPDFEPLRSLDGASVLIVDDVVTTGATLAAAATTLRAAGAGRLAAVTVAHPTRSRPDPPRAEAV